MLVLLSFLIVYLIIGEPLLRKRAYDKFMSDLRNHSPSALSHYYLYDAIRNWLQAIYLFVVAYFFSVPLNAFGFRSINFSYYFALPFYVKILIIMLLVVYFTDLYIMPCVFSRINKKVKMGTIKVLAQMKHLVPCDRREYFWWAMHCFNAISEELMYRGFLFFVLPKLIPGVNILVIFAISGILDGLRFYPRPVIARFVGFSAVCLSVLYVISNSLYIPIIVSVMRYLKLFGLPWSYVTPEDQKAAIGFSVELKSHPGNIP